jgi:glucose/arabinose dehydrogenase
MLLSVAIAGSAIACGNDDAGLTVPPGFCASVFADALGHARQLAVAPNGDLYVNTRSGYSVALRDANGDGHADVIQRFGPAHQNGKGGGTGIAVSGGALYVEDAGSIVRYRLRAGALVPQGAPEPILSGLPIEGDMAHSFAIAPDGALFVNSGAVSNSCQEQGPQSPGIAPCPQLELHAGIWRYEANRTGQVLSSAERFASGTRDAVALAMQPGGLLYATLHGRDQPSASEVFAPVQADDDFGWPYCYYDAAERQYALAPEYGGDGGSKQGECIALKHPRVVFPAHWAPSAMTFYAESAFPRAYRGGAFVAFEAGSVVAFVPFGEDGAVGRYEVFATATAHRPTGVAVGPDGALYVSDEVKGRIWKITYEGVVK